MLPTLALLTTITAVLSSLTATLLASAVAIPIVGRFESGRLRRPTILAGLLVVTLGTALAIVPTSYGVLVAGRAMQGIGMASTRCCATSGSPSAAQ
ncbi:hypothetical protein GCM10023350_26200 [Nocardioides endophyticus]|uniref:Major facilitator superfamily (MFS) profile domain-containing protein n=1 Tax=Nocardioides endophyticus TaxID=1353775 RepID=A0ABP8YV41_9ACTN